MQKYRSTRLRNVPRYILGQCMFRVDEDGVLDLITKVETLDKNTLYSLQNHPSIELVENKTPSSSNADEDSDPVEDSDSVENGVVSVEPMDLESFKVLAEDNFEDARDHARTFGVTARGVDALVERFEVFLSAQVKGEE